MNIRLILPAELALSQTWSENISDLYDVFCETFIHGTVMFNGKPVLHDRRKIFENLEEGFWHIVSRDPLDKRNVTGRVPDFDRACRIGWIRPILENHTCEGICGFKYLEGSGRHRVYLWLTELDHLIILEEMRQAYKLVTAFRITNVWAENDLKSKLRRKLPI